MMDIHWNSRSRRTGSLRPDDEDQAGVGHPGGGQAGVPGYDDPVRLVRAGGAGLRVAGGLGENEPATSASCSGSGRLAVARSPLGRRAVVDHGERGAPGCAGP